MDAGHINLATEFTVLQVGEDRLLRGIDDDDAVCLPPEFSSIGLLLAEAKASESFSLCAFRVAPGFHSYKILLPFVIFLSIDCYLLLLNPILHNLNAKI